MGFYWPNPRYLARRHTVAQNMSSRPERWKGLLYSDLHYLGKFVKPQEGILLPKENS